MTRVRGGRNPLRSQGFKQTDSLKALTLHTEQIGRTSVAYDDAQTRMLHQLVWERQRTNQLLEWIGETLQRQG